MATAREQTPPPTPRHLAELRIDSAHCVVAFSAHCAAARRRKRRCIVPASFARKRKYSCSVVARLGSHAHTRADQTLTAPSSRANPTHSQKQQRLAFSAPLFSFSCSCTSRKNYDKSRCVAARARLLHL